MGQSRSQSLGIGAGTGLSLFKIVSSEGRRGTGPPQRSLQELIFELFDQGKPLQAQLSAGRKPGEIGQGGWGTLFMQTGFQRIERRRVGDKNILLLARALPGKKEDG